MPTKIFMISKELLKSKGVRQSFSPQWMSIVKLRIIIFILDYTSYERTNIVQIANETNCTTTKFHSHRIINKIYSIIFRKSQQKY